MTTNSFGYNGLDARVSKTDSTGTYGFKRNGAGVTDPVLSDGAATYTPGISERRAGSSRFLHSGMKNADAQSGASANVDSSRTYDAFGNLTGSSGSWSGPFGYAGGFGYQEDPDHGLRLLGHRYYDSSTGRFISKDPIGDGRNWTAYCAGNPVSNFDDWGLAPQKMHGNTAGDQRAVLYGKFSKNWKFLKWGVTQEVDEPIKRYPARERPQIRMIALKEGPRHVLLRLERWLVERFPGPENHERWAGSKKITVPRVPVGLFGRLSIYGMLLTDFGTDVRNADMYDCGAKANPHSCLCRACCIVRDIVYRLPGRMQVPL